MSDSPISSHLDRDTLIALAGYSTIGNPVSDATARVQTAATTAAHTITHRLDNDEE